MFGAVCLETEPLTKVETLAGRHLVEHWVEVAERIDNQRAVMRIELPDAAHLLPHQAGVDPEPVGSGPVEWLVLDLPGDQRRIVPVTEGCLTDKGQSGIAKRRVTGHILAGGDSGSRDRRGWDVELGPPERLHAQGEHNRLMTPLRLVHQPVELLESFRLHLVPVGTETDHAKVHRFQPGKRAAAIEAEVGGALGAGAGADLYRPGQAVSLDRRRDEQGKRGGRQKWH